jgi:hypothetical protein
MVVVGRIMMDAVTLEINWHRYLSLMVVVIDGVVVDVGGGVRAS